MNKDRPASVARRAARRNPAGGVTNALKKILKNEARDRMTKTELSHSDFASSIHVAAPMPRAERFPFVGENLALKREKQIAKACA
jgi:hypothetical protein